MSPPSTPRTARAQVGGLSSKHDPDDPRVIAARRNLTTLVMQKYVTETLAKAPPLTDAQVESIIALLRTGAAPE